MTRKKAEISKAAVQTGASVSQCLQLRDLDRSFQLCDLDKSLLLKVLENIINNLNVMGVATDIFMGVDIDIKLFGAFNSPENQDISVQIARKIHWHIRNAIERVHGKVVRSWYDLSFILGVSGKAHETTKFQSEIMDAATIVGFPETALKKFILDFNKGDFDLIYKKFIDSANDIIDTPVVFISHATKDHVIAEELAELLHEYGLNSFVASIDIFSGEDWESRLREELRRADEILLVISPDSAHSSWVMIEVGASWALGKQITPCVLYKNIASLPEPIRRFQARSILTMAQRRQVITEMAQRLKASVLNV